MGARTTKGVIGGVAGFVLAPRRMLCATGLALIASILGGCSGMSDVSVESVLVVPGKYNLQGCQEIESNLRNRRAQAAAMEKAMEQTSNAPGGEVVNLMVYRTDYLQNRGEIDELTRTAANKQCSIQSPWTSGRTIF
jgi:hypothetical protein